MIKYSTVGGNDNLPHGDPLSTIARRLFRGYIYKKTSAGFEIEPSGGSDEQIGCLSEERLRVGSLGDYSVYDVEMFDLGNVVVEKKNIFTDVVLEKFPVMTIADATEHLRDKLELRK
tara:strand:- start:210 stop:560 length:351 start_codon:yes stop_codon:yes gene_type:complete